MEIPENERHAYEQARLQLESIQEMVQALRGAIKDNNEDAIDEARTVISEDPLSVEVRSDWHSPGENCEDVEFNILLCTGGPAVRIIGDIGLHGEPEKPRVQYQDWFTPWKEYPMTTEQEQVVLEYCREFYFGE